MTEFNYKIAIASDHAGFFLKQQLIPYILPRVIKIHDFGAYSSQSSDYPDFIHPLALALKNKEYDLGIVMCGSGNGVNITANKYAHIRSALCWVPDLATLGRKHNNANVLALPARFIDVDNAKAIVDAFLSSSFEGGRHQVRVNKITLYSC
jgi:ribose 5-phosphate isomerase B